MLENYSKRIVEAHPAMDEELRSQILSWDIQLDTETGQLTAVLPDQRRVSATFANVLGFGTGLAWYETIEGKQRVLDFERTPGLGWNWVTREGELSKHIYVEKTMERNKPPHAR